ncbi:MAG: flagellar export chaperone FliS [Alphaproteobacteria bacterium]
MKSAAQAARLYGAAAAPSPLAELVEVHDGMIAKLAEAKQAIADGRIEDRFNLTQKVAAVIDVLQMSLDHEQGGEIAQNLDRLYLYFFKRLTDINIKNDAAICDELMARFADLRDGWRAVAAGGAPAAASTASGASLSA